MWQRRGSASFRSWLENGADKHKRGFWLFAIGLKLAACNNFLFPSRSRTLRGKKNFAICHVNFIGDPRRGGQTPYLGLLGAAVGGIKPSCRIMLMSSPG